MNKEIMKKAGFGKQVDLVDQGKCPFCQKKIDIEKEFRNETSEREFKISGLCQKCQDDTFGRW